MVQAHIKATGGPDIKTELVLTGLGRADVVDKSLGVVWEVKHSGMFPDKRMLDAAIQALGYVGGQYEDILIIGLGEADRFEGVFCITCDGHNYEVSYNTPMDGVILYSVQETANQQEEYAYAYAYIPKMANEDQSAVVGFFGVVGFSGGVASFDGAGRNNYSLI